MTSIVAANTTSEQAMLIDNWTARKTEDNKVSVIDVIADVTKKSYKYASNLYKKLIHEERIPQCEDRALAPRTDLRASSNPGNTRNPCTGFARTSQLTPVATVAEMVEIVWQLPGTADFRRNCARDCRFQKRSCAKARLEKSLKKLDELQKGALAKNQAIQQPKNRIKPARK
jgi:hypothetical protein